MTHNPRTQLNRIGPLKGPVPLLLTLFALCLFSTFASGQTEDPNAFVTDSLLGVSIGTSLTDAHAKLDSLGENGGRETRSGGRKESWALESTGFRSISLKTDRKGNVVWVTGFMRPGQEVRFEELGDMEATTRSNEFEAIWNVKTEEGGFRLVAKGQNGKAHVVYLLSLEAPPIE